MIVRDDPWFVINRDAQLYMAMRWDQWSMIDDND